MKFSLVLFALCTPLLAADSASANHHYDQNRDYDYQDINRQRQNYNRQIFRQQTYTHYEQQRTNSYQRYRRIRISCENGGRLIQTSENQFVCEYSRQFYRH